MLKRYTFLKQKDSLNGEKDNHLSFFYVYDVMNSWGKLCHRPFTDISRFIKGSEYRASEEANRLWRRAWQIYMDKLSGKDFNRPGYQKLTRRKVEQGDLIVVQSLDRLGRNYGEILEEWKWITCTRKVHIKILDMPILDTCVDQDLIGTLICNLVLELLSFVRRTNAR